MAWTPPITFVAGQVFTASQANIHMRDNANYLHTTPGAKAYRTVPLALPAGTFVTVAFNAEVPYGWDVTLVGSQWHNSGGPNPERFTAHETIRCQFCFNALFDGSSGYRIARIRYSNAAGTYVTSIGGTSNTAIGGDAQTGLCSVAFRYMEPGDFVFAEVLSSVGGTNLLHVPEESAFFTVNRVGG